jgi:hypothetical protein
MKCGGSIDVVDVGASAPLTPVQDAAPASVKPPAPIEVASTTSSEVSSKAVRAHSTVVVNVLVYNRMSSFSRGFVRFWFVLLAFRSFCAGFGCHWQKEER